MLDKKPRVARMQRSGIRDDRATKPRIPLRSMRATSAQGDE